ncbi:MAG: HprK-related kinase A [Acidobacteria bacterium]|nr:HprK-related kinase A [Acidobacteriota bacterium]
MVDTQLEIGPFLARVRSPLAAVSRHLALLYPDYRQRPGAAGHFDVVVAPGRGVRRWVRRQARAILHGIEPYLPVPEDLAGPSMEWSLNWCIGTRAHQWVVMHAATLERGGRALVMPAPPGAGKSTLCAALAYSRWRLFSDEFALLHPVTGAIHPAPRPLSLKNASIEIIRGRHPDVALSPECIDIEGARFVHARPPADSVRRSSEPATPGWLVLPRYVPGSPTIFEPLPRAHALARLADQSFNYNVVGPAGFRGLEHLVRASACYRLEYSDLDDALGRFDELACS